MLIRLFPTIISLDLVSWAYKPRKYKIWNNYLANKFVTHQRWNEGDCHKWRSVKSDDLLLRIIFGQNAIKIFTGLSFFNKIWQKEKPLANQQDNICSFKKETTTRTGLWQIQVVPKQVHLIRLSYKCQKRSWHTWLNYLPLGCLALNLFFLKTYHDWMQTPGTRLY